MTALLIIGIPCVYVILQWAALARMRAGWHVAAILPAVMMAGALALMAVGIALRADFAAVAIVIGLPLATAYLLVLWPLHMALKGN